MPLEGGQHGDNSERRSRGYTNKLAASGGSTTSIEGEETAVIQINGAVEGEVGREGWGAGGQGGRGAVRRQQREEKMRLYTKKRPLGRVSTTTIERGEAEAMQMNGAASGGRTATIERGEEEAIQINGAAKGAVRRP